MPPQGVLLQPKLPGLVEVANDDNCDATIIESSDDTDGTEIESDNQICEDEAEWEENEERATRGINHETIEGRIALNNGLLRDAIKQPKMLQTQLAKADLRHLDRMMRHYDNGTRRFHAGQKEWNKALNSISVMALLAEKEGIWGPFVVVTMDSTLYKWQQEINVLVPRFKLQPYRGTAADRKVLRTFWDRKQNVYTQDSPFHVLITSYQLVLLDAAYFQKMRWQFVILDDADAIKSTAISKIQDLLRCYSDPVIFHKPVESQTDQADITQNAEQPSDTEIIRKRKVRPSRRSHGRIDGLEHLCKFPAGIHGFNTELIQLLVPAPPAVGGNEADEMQPLHGIAFCLIRLNISILEARDNAHQNNDYSLFSSIESSHMNGLLTVDEYERLHTTSTISMDGAQEARLVEYINTFSTEQIIRRIRDPKALPYMPKMFENRLLTWETWKGQRKMLENDPDFVIPTQYKAGGKAEYANTCVYNYRILRQIIRNLYTITLHLRKHAIAACSSKMLDDISVRQLKAKMTALQPGFQETCEELGYPREQLVWDTQPWW
jgi:hypothetical protein